MSHEALELVIARFLRIGAGLSGLLLAVGWFTRLLAGRAEGGFDRFAEHKPVTLVTSLSSAWAAGDTGLLIAYAGLGVLISLPVLRVAFVALLFVRNRERALAAAAAFVLLVLGLSFWLGFEV